MLFLRRGQGAAQIAGRIALGPAGRHGVAEDLPAVLHRPVRRFQRAPALDPAQHGQQLGRFDLGDRPLAEPGEDVPFEPPQDAVAVARHPSRRELRVPLARDGLEALRARLRELLRLARLRQGRCRPRAAGGRRRASRAPLSGSRRDRRRSESRFSLPPKRYFQRHHLPPAGLTSRYRPPPSNSLKALSCGLAERIAVSVSGMWGQLPFQVHQLPPKLPPIWGQL